MLNPPSILLVEDRPVDIALTRRAFLKARLANPLVDVQDGEAAMDYLVGRGMYADRQNYPMPFLVLLDLNLPRISGLEVLEWIRQQPALRTLRVVILTSSREAPHIERAYALGADGYLVKPGHLDQLVEMMTNLKCYWAMSDDRPGSAVA